MTQDRSGETRACQKCGGSGRVEHLIGSSSVGDRYLSVRCDRCDGTGKVALSLSQDRSEGVGEAESNVESAAKAIWRKVCELNEDDELSRHFPKSWADLDDVSRETFRIYARAALGSQHRSPPDGMVLRKALAEARLQIACARRNDFAQRRDKALQIIDQALSAAPSAPSGERGE